MPRARLTDEPRQTAAVFEDQGGGCLSGFAFVPLTVMLISALLGLLAWSSSEVEIISVLPEIPIEQTPVTESLETANSLSPIFRAEVLYWSESIIKWAEEYQIAPNLAATIMQIESCGDPRAVSSAGAMGLFQVMPFHFSITDDPYRPDTNAARGLAYLKRSLEAGSGDVRLAMAGYNGGIGVINRWEGTWHSQTRRYVEYGFPIYLDAVNGLSSSPTLDDWYTRYGVSLCRQAALRIGLQ